VLFIVANTVGKRGQNFHRLDQPNGGHRQRWFTLLFSKHGCRNTFGLRIFWLTERKHAVCLRVCKKNRKSWLDKMFLFCLLNLLQMAKSISTQMWKLCGTKQFWERPWKNSSLKTS